MFPYFGGKSRLAPTYQPPQHDLIIEPFAGGAAYATHWLMRRANLRAVVVERDEACAALWRRLLAMTGDDIRALPDVKQGDRTSDLLVSLSNYSWAQIAAVANSGSCVVSSWIAEGWPKTREKVAHRRDVIGDRLEIVEGDYTESPDVEASWFIDPPYQHQGHLYRTGSDLLDFDALAVWCRSRQGHVQVCEADPADWLPFEPHRMSIDVKNQPKKELVWYSDPPLRLFN